MVLVSPASPAIDGDLFDEDIFDDQIGRQAAGYDEGDEDEEVDDDSEFAEGLREEEDMDEETYPDICTWSNFPPKPDSNLWKHNDFDLLPDVFYDKARQDMYKCVEEEVECITSQFHSAAVRGDPEGTEKAVYILFGPRSSTYHVFSKIFPKEDYEYFTRYLAAFFFSSSLNSTYGQCYQEPKIDTDDFCSEETYLDIWFEIDQYNICTNGKRSWLKFEDALNETLTETFVPPRGDLKAQTTMDDDKRLHQYRSLRKIPIDEESGIARQHHTRVNRKGFNW